MPLLSQTTLLAEINEDQLCILNGNHLHETKLERLPNGRLTPACLQRLQSELPAFLHARKWLPPQPVTCAIHARGVSLRHITLPDTNGDQQLQLLPLQIEHTFPLPPQDLAWGAILPPGHHSSTPHTVPVFALRRESLADYETLFNQCHCIPTFTLASLIRTRLCPSTPDHWSILHLQPQQSELITFNNQQPATLQLLPWGHTSLLNHPNTLEHLNPTLVGSSLHISWNPRDCPNPTPILQALRSLVGSETTISTVLLDHATPRTAALQALQAQPHNNHPPLKLTLQAQQSKPRPLMPTSAHYTWAIASTILLLTLTLLHLLHSSQQQTRLTQAINQVREVRQSLPLVDQQLGFLSYLQTNRQPYLRILATVAQSATPGLQIESLSLNRRGELLIRGTLQGQQPPTDFRTKLVESGAFTSVVLEEQTPGQQQDNIAFRIAAHWDPAQARNLPELPPAPPLPSIPGMPPGMPMPMPIPGGSPIPPEALPVPPDAMIHLQ